MFRIHRHLYFMYILARCFNQVPYFNQVPKSWFVLIAWSLSLQWGPYFPWFRSKAKIYYYSKLSRETTVIYLIHQVKTGLVLCCQYVAFSGILRPPDSRTTIFESEMSITKTRKTFEQNKTQFCSYFSRSIWYLEYKRNLNWHESEWWDFRETDSR